MMPPFDSRLIRRLRRLVALFQMGEFGPTSHEAHPAFSVGSRERYLYFTLPAAINFQRKSETLWQSAHDTFVDPESCFAFDPVNALEDPERTRWALLRYRLSLQTNRHTTTWLRLCATLAERYDSDPRKLLRSEGHDVLRVIALLRREKKAFPCLSGPKMANYWLYVVSRFTDAPLAGRDELSIIPDVHVTRATHHLGLLPLGRRPTPELVAEIWRHGLRGSGIAPPDLHAPLWRWSRANFEPTI